MDACGDWEKGYRVVDMRRKGKTERQELMNGWRYWSMFVRRSGMMDGEMGVRGAEEWRIWWMWERLMDKLVNGFMEG